MRAKSQQAIALREALCKVIEELRSSGVAEAARITWVAPRVGERTGASGIGKETLTTEMVTSCKKSPTEIARGYWPLEWWGGNSRRPEMTYLPDGEYYSLTEGMVTSAKSSNLYFAGRTISAEEHALASARVIATSMATGEGAAALAVNGFNVRPDDSSF